MTTTASKMVITLMMCSVSVCLAQPQGTQTPPPPTSAQEQKPTPSSTDQGGQAVPGGGEVKGNFVTMLTLVLNLTADQQTQVKALFEAARVEAKAIGDSKTWSPDDKRAKIQEVREATNRKIRPLLTPDQQQRFDELLKQIGQGPATPKPSTLAPGPEPGASAPPKR